MPRRDRLVAAMQQIEEWLKDLGMPEYAERFAENKIDISVLPDLTDQHLKDLGVWLGHRLKMLRAIRDLSGASVAVTASSAGGALRSRAGPHCSPASRWWPPPTGGFARRRPRKPKPMGCHHSEISNIRPTLRISTTSIHTPPRTAHSRKSDPIADTINHSLP